MEQIDKRITALVMDEKGMVNISNCVRCIISNNKVGKTLTIGDNERTFTFAFEQIEKYLK